MRPLVDGVAAFERIGHAIEHARHSVWLTVAFFALDFCFPGRGSGLFDVLDRAVHRGLDVRVLFWRPNAESCHYGRTFPGSRANRDMLRARGSRFRIRWDRAYGSYCQHQKSWVIDAGQSTETAFVGGINLTAANMGSPGHLDADQRHDCYVEVIGPAATDVHHNFIQRWNEASERGCEDGVWGHDGSETLPFPTHLSGPCGVAWVQIQRMVHPHRYADDTPSHGGMPHDIRSGERSILEQYVRAIDAARRSIYIENQALPIPAIAGRLEEALKRGVDVVYLAPAEPDGYGRAARDDPSRKAFLAGAEALGGYQNFLLAGIAAPNGDGGRSNIYVHAKTMLVDDEWATIGSCNLHSNSLSGHTEMNASFWAPDTVRALRCQLLSEHLDIETAHLDDRAALRRYRRIARENWLRGTCRDFNWQGLAFAVSPAAYGRSS